MYSHKNTPDHFIFRRIDLRSYVEVFRYKESALVRRAFGRERCLKLLYPSLSKLDNLALQTPVLNVETDLPWRTIDVEFFERVEKTCGTLGR